MRYMIMIAIFGMTGLFACPARAQFDLGDVFRGEARQFVQGVEREIRGQIQRGHFPRYNPPRYEILPYPPVVQPPRCAQPPIITGPVVQPAPQPPQQPVVDSQANGARTTRPQPAPLPKVELGSVVSIEGQGFGDEPGAVFIKIGQLVLTAELVEWTDELVEAQMPDMPMADRVRASIFVMAATEEIVEQTDVALLPASHRLDPANGQTEGDAEQVDLATLPQITSGEEITLEGDLGPGEGRVELVIGSVRLNASVKQWSDSAATIQLPTIEAQEPVAAELIIYDADGEVVEQLQVGFSG